jgi:3-dehydroquinate synthase
MLPALRVAFYLNSAESMKKLLVKLKDRSYPVWIGAGVHAHAGRILSRLGFDSPPVIVSNAKVLRLCGEVLIAALQNAFGPSTLIRIGDGEQYKNQKTLAKIYDGLFRARADRRSWIVALGGGVVGDVAGYAAATYMRGIPYIGMPTTLLSQVDSSVGGKVAINVTHGKNLIGAFHQPAAVLSDTDTLRTLPARELASGLFEVVKCGAIRSRHLLTYLENRLDAVLAVEPRETEHAILESVRIKADVVAQDEREDNLRAILNFGHTVGHALEAASDYRRFKHGEAVAWGMIAAAELSVSLGKVDGQEAQRLIQLIQRIETLPSLRGLSAEGVWRSLQKDKKSVDGRVRMVLLQSLGHAHLVTGLDPGHLRHLVTSFLNNAVTLP